MCSFFVNIRLSVLLIVTSAYKRPPSIPNNDNRVLLGIRSSPTRNMSATANVTNGAAGNPLSSKSQILETGASVAQVVHLFPYDLRSFMN